MHQAEIGGVPYRLHFKFGTIRLFERELGKPIAEVFDFFGRNLSEAELEKAAARIPLDAWSAFFWATLQPAHMMSREAADDLIDEAGMEQVVRWLFAGFAAYSAGDPALLELALAEAGEQGGPEGNAPAAKRRPASKGRASS